MKKNNRGVNTGPYVTFIFLHYFFYFLTFFFTVWLFFLLLTFFLLFDFYFYCFTFFLLFKKSVRYFFQLFTPRKEPPKKKTEKNTI